MTDLPSAAPDADRPSQVMTDPRVIVLRLLVETTTYVQTEIARGLGGLGITPPELGALLRLSRLPGHSARIGALADQTPLSPSAYSRLVDRLEAAGLVARSPGDADKRVVQATLTPRGEDLLEDAVPALLDSVDASFTGLLDEDELAALDQTLRKVLHHLNPGSDAELAPS